MTAPIVHTLSLANHRGPAALARCGWATPRDHWHGWALAAHLAASHGPAELVTDSAGARVLVDALRLPYSRVDVCLDKPAGPSPTLWSYPKVRSYARQLRHGRPFVHTDADVFLWRPLPPRILSAPVAVQSIEPRGGINGWLHYGIAGARLSAALHDLPACWPRVGRTVYNLGLLAVTDLDLLARYVAAVDRLVLSPSNRAGWRGMGPDLSAFAWVVEQGVAGAAFPPGRVECLIDESRPDVDAQAVALGYTHEMQLKHNAAGAAERAGLARRVRRDYPDVAERIDRLLADAPEPAHA